MLLSLAWRNLWRNARRTIITLAALTLGVSAIIGLRSYRDSTFKQVVAQITRELVGNIQVTAKGYRTAPEVGAVVREPQAIEAIIEGAVPGVSVERRVIGAGLGGSGDSSSGVMISGIAPGARPLDIKKGKTITTTGEAVVGVELAEQLQVKPGSEIVLVGQAADGSVANDRYTIVGVADAGSFELNATAVFLHIDDAQSFFGIGDAVHQIVLRLPEDTEQTDAVQAVRNALDLKTLEALSWNEILPELTGTIESKQQGQNAIDFILFIIVALGVLNAMTMATFERTREFGVMLALGTRPRRIVGLIVTESLLQGAIALVLGLALVAVAFAVFGEVNLGSTFGASDFAGVRLPSVVHLAISAKSIKAAAVVAFSTVLVGGLIPALRAARLKPIEALGSF